MRRFYLIEWKCGNVDLIDVYQHYADLLGGLVVWRNGESGRFR